MKKILVLAIILSFCLITFSAYNENEIAVISEVPIAEVSESKETTIPKTSLTETSTTRITTTTVPETTEPIADNTLLTSQIEQVCEKYNVTGMSMAVFKGQDIVYTKSYGYSDVENNIAANENTKFRIASISKTITGIIAMRLVAEGKLNLDEDISNYIGINMKSPYFPDTKITTKQLLTHTSGIIDSSTYKVITDGYVYPSLQELMSYGGMYTNFAPDTHYIYSNLAEGIICGVIEGITQQRFYTYAKDTLFSEMNINAGFLRTQISDPENIALIYFNNEISANTKTWGRVESAYDTIPIGQMYLLGYGDLYITANDLAKFGIALAGNGTYNGYEILPEEYINQMNTLHFQEDSYKQGLAVSITDKLVDGRTMYGHPGQSYGMVSGLYYDPTDSTGVAFITNGCTVQKNSDKIYTISYELINNVYANYPS